jgi:hypothetical protein
MLIEYKFDMFQYNEWPTVTVVQKSNVLDLQRSVIVCRTLECAKKHSEVYRNK